MDFWFENKPSGNPGLARLMQMISRKKSFGKVARK
jgi:hypothetical protein